MGQEFAVQGDNETVFIQFSFDHVHAHVKVNGRDNSVALFLVGKHLQAKAIVLHGFNEAIYERFLTNFGKNDDDIVRTCILGAWSCQLNASSKQRDQTCIMSGSKERIGTFCMVARSSAEIWGTATFRSSAALGLNWAWLVKS